MSTSDTIGAAPAGRTRLAQLRDATQLLQAIPDGLLWLDLHHDGTLEIVALRPQDRQLADRTVADTGDDALATALREQLEAVLATRRTRAFTHSTRGQMDERHTDIRIVPGDGTTALAILRDVSEQRRLETELQAAQRLEAIGRLAGGIAHEINTPIQFIGDNVRFLQQSFGTTVELLGTYRACLFGDEQLSRDDRRAMARAAEDRADVDFLVEEVPTAAQDTLDGVERVAGIVRAMKTFGRSPSPDQAPADINAALENTVIVSRSEHKHVADVVTDLGDLPPVTCHIGEISQVLLNLIVNGAHAIAERARTAPGRGRIEIRTTRDGDRVLIEIADDGCGVPEDIRARIFEPMFTTKEVGKGTGQGLALSRSIVVDHHGGSITVRSAVGVGTTFRIALPIDGQRDAAD